jgi:predicted transposase/invertase (TIGR01784 family)
LIHFLNDVIVFKERQPIVDVTFLKTIQDPETASKKTSIVDIMCKDEKGNSYIVEMQIAREKGFEKRAQYYAAKAYVSQAKVKGQYFNLKEIIFLAISDKILFPNKKEYISDHVILDKKNHDNDLKDFSFTFIELEKFNKTIDQLETIVDKWSYFFKHAEEVSEQDVSRIVDHDLIFERVFHELDRFSWSDEELLTYDQAEKYEEAFLASLAFQFDEGLAKGKAEGLVQGKAEGEKAMAQKIAKSLLKKGVPLKEVSLLTQLPIEAIEIVENA